MGAIKTRLNYLRMKKKKHGVESKRVLLSTLAILKRHRLVGKDSKKLCTVQIRASFLCQMGVRCYVAPLADKW